MKKVGALLFACVLASPVQAQVAREITFFSGPGMSGARFTVTGPRTNLSIPYIPRSAILQGGGSWQICSAANYRGRCEVINSDRRDLSFGPIRSIRQPAAVPAPSPAREIARLSVRDRADRDTAYSTDRQTMFREVQVCSERSTIRIRRAEVQFGNGTWQRLFLPLTLEHGECSKPVDLLGNGRRIRAVRFEYETWTAGMRRGVISVKALPFVTAQPR